MKPLLMILCAAFLGGVLLYGRARRNFVIFQIVMLPIFLYFFAADVVLGKSQTASGLWFLPFALLWFVGSAGLGAMTLRHLWRKDSV